MRGTLLTLHFLRSVGAQAQAERRRRGNFDFSLFTIHFSLKNAMTQETKNKWSVIINAILTTLTALLSAFGLA